MSDNCFRVKRRPANVVDFSDLISLFISTVCPIILQGNYAIGEVQSQLLFEIKISSVKLTSYRYVVVFG